MTRSLTSSSEQTNSSGAERSKDQWVPETRFGKWFLSTGIWYRFVLTEAIRDLHNLVGEHLPKQPTLLDLGCGEGASFSLLEQYLKPASITAIDIDLELLEGAKLAASNCCCEVSVQHGTAKKLSIPDNTFDVVFCHQLFHHITFREEALKEVYRVLKPGGRLLFSESCNHFLRVYWVAWLFRHPKMVQKTAEGYITLIQDAGFSLTENDILESTPWWSRRDFGLLKKYGLQVKPSKTTEISVVATKPETE